MKVQSQKFGIWLIESKNGKLSHLKIVNRNANPIKSYAVVGEEAALKYAAKDTGSIKMSQMGLYTDTINDFTATLLVESGLKSHVLKVKKSIKRSI